MNSSFWSDYRLGKAVTRQAPDTTTVPTAVGAREEHRSPYQRDYDRLLFSSPVRRLADKTQVFPLEPNDSVRTRLTHSHEVSNLARSIGARLDNHGHGLSCGQSGISITEILAILQSIGLAHDLGNPPFGHQGEKAISNWFSARTDLLEEIPVRLRNEFVKFEGNAQTLRILTRLQQGVGEFGLDLTVATLAALMKYPVPCDKTGESPESKKYGFFETERQTVEAIWKRTGLSEGKRHPLAWIMEAADDIAYSVLDVEDAIKKGIISPEDVYFTLKSDIRNDCGPVCLQLKEDFKRIRELRPNATVAAAREIKAGYLRTRLIDQLIDEAVASYISQRSAIEGLLPARGLLDESKLCKRLKRIAREHAFSSTAVTRVEANGASALSQLMTFFWDSIRTRDDIEDLDSRRYEKYAYGWSLFSDNYKSVAVINFNNCTRELRTYHECKLLSDMISGMTDGFAMTLHRTLQAEGHLRDGNA